MLTVSECFPSFLPSCTDNKASFSFLSISCWWTSSLAVSTVRNCCGEKKEEKKNRTDCYYKQNRKRECHLNARKMIYTASYKRNTTVFEFTSTSRICSECLPKHWVTIFFKKAFSFLRLLTDVRSFELSLFWNKFLYFEDAIGIICWYNEWLLKENNKIKNCVCVFFFLKLSFY